MFILKIILALAAGYLLGSLNTSVIVGKIYGKDIREHGSKGAGLTNALRVLGKPAAAIVLAGDVLKGVAACLFGLALDAGFYTGDATICLLAAGAAAVIGHNWPLYFGFKVGKGVLTAVAVLFMADWLMALICLSFFAVIVALTRYVSLGSICAALLFAVIAFIPLFGGGAFLGVFACVIAALIIFRHRANIKRLLSGTENKLIFKKGGQTAS